ncbi:MAG: DUF3348 family protein [Rubrivivax sp.]|nr:MAG: DUF3348 family protein [Rubrivivax sp.]
MARESHRTPPTGSAFIRLLASMTDAQAPASPDDFAQRLTQWFDWTHTMSLSTALSEAPVPADTEAGTSIKGTAPDDEREHARVKATLARQIDQACSGTVAARPRATVVSPLAPTLGEMLDIGGHRRRYVACQQAMDAQIGPWRRRLRATLSGQSPALARLATLDGLMEQVVGAQERVLLSGVPALLERRFEQLRRAHADRQAGQHAIAASDQPGLVPQAMPVPTPSPVSVPWLDHFRRDMNALLLAELELRLQPVEGLLDASRNLRPRIALNESP